MRNSLVGSVLVALTICLLSTAYSEERPTNVISTGLVDLFAAFDGWYSIVEYERSISENSAFSLGAFHASNDSHRTSSELNMQLNGVESSYRFFSPWAEKCYLYYGGGLNIFELQAKRTTTAGIREEGSAICFEPKVMIGGTFRKRQGFTFTFGLEFGYLISDLKLIGEPVPGSGSSFIGRPFMNVGWGW